MGNCLNFLLQAFSPSPPTPSVQPKVSINCACFQSKIADDDDDEVDNEKDEEQEPQESLCATS